MLEEQTTSFILDVNFMSKFVPSNKPGTLLLILRWSYGTNSGAAWALSSAMPKAFTCPRMMIGMAAKKKPFFQVSYPPAVNSFNDNNEAAHIY